MKKRVLCLMLGAVLLVSLVSLIAADEDKRQPVIPNLPASPLFSASTVPANGDLNPYGVAFVPRGFRGPLEPGDVLVSNFNNLGNQQGTGTTIVRITPRGHTSLFFQGAAGLGLTTALGVLKRGFVLVGSLPSPTGSCTPGPGGQELGVGQGSLLVINRHGALVKTLTDPNLLDGPWDLTVHDEGARVQVFISNALNGSVTRLDLRVPGDGDDSDDVIVEGMTRIASGYVHRCDPAALVVGPTGLAYDAKRDTLYVASTGDNAIFAVARAGEARHDAGMGSVVYQDNAHLRGPLGLLLAPNGDLLTSNGDAVNPDPNFASEIVEFTPEGKFIAQFSVDAAPGSAFGMALEASEDQLRFAAVDDNLNVLDVWKIE
jgi:hypothetical protein